MNGDTAESFQSVFVSKFISKRPSNSDYRRNMNKICVYIQAICGEEYTQPILYKKTGGKSRGKSSLKENHAEEIHFESPRSDKIIVATY